MSTLLDKYQQQIDKQAIFDDPIQRSALDKLQSVYEQLTRKKKFWHLLFNKKKITKGIYLWGGVGSGKTFLMDLFYDSLPFPQKTRRHFHAFMQEIQLKLRSHQGQKNPLESIAKEISEKTKVLCFDEFFVSDIADAMILERLFSKLFEKGIILIATSNIPPKDLYKDGLHHRRFQPAIKLIQKKCQIINIQTNTDYRFINETQHNIFFQSKKRSTDDEMYKLFQKFNTNNNIKENTFIHLEGRWVKTRYVANDSIWFDFNIICHTPRSQVDYLYIAQKYKKVFITGVPVMSEKDKVSITYFIYLIDIFYDNHTQLYLSIEDKIENLYIKGDKFFEYQRTISRLHEMRSEEYKLAHT